MDLPKRRMRKGQSFCPESISNSQDRHSLGAYFTNSKNVSPLVERKTSTGFIVSQLSLCSNTSVWVACVCRGWEIPRKNRWIFLVFCLFSECVATSLPYVHSSKRWPLFTMCLPAVDERRNKKFVLHTLEARASPVPCQMAPEKIRTCSFILMNKRDHNHLEARLNNMRYVAQSSKLECINVFQEMAQCTLRTSSFGSCGNNISFCSRFTVNGS